MCHAAASPIPPAPPARPLPAEFTPRWRVRIVGGPKSFLFADLRAEKWFISREAAESHARSWRGFRDVTATVEPLDGFEAVAP